MDENKSYRIVVIGQGYVGLPLSLEFATHYPVLGFDINRNRINQLNRGHDITLEADTEKLNNLLKKYIKTGGKLGYKATNELEEISQSNVFIVTVPISINKYNTPDLGPLIFASKMLSGIIKEGDIIIYESTVFPGCTEEECIPILEKYPGLKYNESFYIGYSPERINQGDKVNTLTSVKKVTSGSTKEIVEEIDNLYRKIITAGTQKAPSIKVTEASKAIENAQRDVNISVANELTLIFNRIGIDVDIFDPWVDKAEVENEYGIAILNKLSEDRKYDSIIIAVSHHQFLKLNFGNIKKENAVIYDTKTCIDRNLIDARL
ncbi:nucleotide sugar dehydrogenase [Chryseobacterium luteum]|uniref:UDP-glucose/GDP-mannose dehydrogenase C-terminal domain-containing protein n=1 Tax=Chryseobacterium luteum TaxID=421531 RepID=A0A085ZHP9_9FLAO|nr:nucleotide sugar dehydrogenase [Chryseobacterium luteum]KFF03963.1 hypothetical protein IX38_11260 [Chryseobacterium luteum]